MQTGPIIGYPSAASIMNNWGWEAVFYMQGAIVFVWCCFWFTICSDEPENFKWISQVEIQYIRSSIGESKQKQKVGLCFLL